jgi:hypothetical protein
MLADSGGHWVRDFLASTLDRTRWGSSQQAQPEWIILIHTFGLKCFVSASKWIILIHCDFRHATRYPDSVIRSIESFCSLPDAPSAILTL